MTADYQRIARRDKKAFLSDQCKEIEENNCWERLKYMNKYKAADEVSKDIAKRLTNLEEKLAVDIRGYL